MFEARYPVAGQRVDGRYWQRKAWGIEHRGQRRAERAFVALGTFNSGLALGLGSA